MATTPGALNIAIFARLRGTEVLAGDLAAAQAITSAYKWRLGSMTKDGALPACCLYEDAGVDAMPYAPDVGILQNSVRRFEFWTQSLDDSFFTNLADACELLFDFRRGGSLMNIGGDGLIYDSSLFTGMQGPIHDDDTNAYYATMAFQFVEARP